MAIKKVKIGISVDADLWAKAKAQAVKDKRTIAGVVELALLSYLNNNRQETPNRK